MTLSQAVPRLLIILLLTSTAISANISVIASAGAINHLSAQTASTRLNNGMFVLETMQTTGTFADVSELADSHWRHISQSSLYVGNGQSEPVWIKLRLQRDSNATPDWILSIDWPLLQQVEWYVSAAPSSTLIDQGQFTNWKIPAEAPDQFPFAVPVHMAADTTYDVYLRVASTEKTLVPLTMWTRASFQAHQLQRNLFLGLFYGVLLAMFGYNLALYLYLRHKSYAAYCTYVLAMGSYTLIINGAGVAWHWAENTWLIAHAYRLFVPLGFLGAVMFIRQFLNLYRQAWWLNISSKVAIYVWGLVIIIAPFVPSARVIPFIDLFGFINCLYGFSISAYLWYRGDKSAKYLTIAWFILIIATIILVLGLTGFIIYQIELHYLQNIGVVIEVLLLSTALAERMNRERQRRFEAQNLALQLSNEATLARENEMLAKEQALTTERKAKQELSVKVNEQTRELKVAMEKMRILNKELESLSQTDPLTGLANRRYFDSRFEQEIQRAKRAKSSISVLMMDIDHFKLINDTYGHQAGDKVIQTVSALIQRVSGRASDFPARLGGEEFCLLVTNEDQQHILSLGEAIRSAAQHEAVHYQQQIIHYTLSIGIYTLVPTLNDAADVILKCADDALYQAKKQGRNRVVIFSAQGLLRASDIST